MELSIKLSPANKEATIDEIKTRFNEHFPHQIFEYSSMEENFEWLFRNEDTTAKTAGYFSILAIFISCLGLFGLSSFTAEQKRKEIGIRKVLGGSVLNVVYQLVKESLRPVVAAIIIALPVAYYFIGKWLQEFAYRIEISYIVLIISSLSAIIIALITVGYQSVKAAIANPADTLKYE
ncbi:MAG: hypothetical protein PVH88_06405 [Ignavibacteria bacterium]|jgi:putative ABC transport system permease protein